jgi:hypothetical protein
MSDRRVHLTITCLGCSTASQGYADLCTVELLGSGLMRNNRRRTFEAARNVVISVCVDRCENCKPKDGADGK